MEAEKVFHDWLINHLKYRLSKDYSEIHINTEKEKKKEFRGYYPDLILESHGIVTGVIEVETERGISPEKAKEWKEISRLGVRLTILVPERSRAKVMNLLWNEGIAQDVAIGSYELRISLP